MSASAAACGGSVTGSPSDSTGGTGGTAASGGTGGTGGLGGMGGTGGIPTTGGFGGTGLPEAGPDTAPPGDLAVPPAPPSNGAAGAGPGVTLAVSQMFLGDTTPDGMPSSDAWRSYGYDIDGQISSKTSTYHCKVNEGGNKAAIQTDGPGGIDNSWGYNIMPIIVGLASDATVKLNENIDDGPFTVLFRIDEIGGKSNYVSLHGAFYHAAELGHAPMWNGNDTWPVECSGGAENAKPPVPDPCAYY